MKTELQTGKFFSAKSTIYSHGWVDLQPFLLDTITLSLRYSFILDNSIDVSINIYSESDKIVILQTNRYYDEKIQKIIISKVKRMFRLDEDLSEFYKIAEKDLNFKWALEKGAGRLLRCATLWEDMVKMLCTTNCTWRLTQIMVENLVNILGSNAFPSPEMIANTNEKFLREKIKMGYRAPYLLEFAQNVVNGKIDLQKFDNWHGNSENLYKELRRIKGFGDYAVSNLMKLLGRYDYMGIDSWSRKQFAIKHKNGNSCSDEEITEFYENFEKWAGLFFWVDVTKEWYYKRQPWV